MCFSCSSSDDKNENEELWTPVDREIIDKYEDSRVLMGTVWGWKKVIKNMMDNIMYGFMRIRHVDIYGL